MELFHFYKGFSSMTTHASRSRYDASDFTPSAKRFYKTPAKVAKAARQMALFAEGLKQLTQNDNGAPALSKDRLAFLSDDRFCKLAAVVLNDEEFFSRREKDRIMAVSAGNGDALWYNVFIKHPTFAARNAHVRAAPTVNLQTGVLSVGGIRMQLPPEKLGLFLDSIPADACKTDAPKDANGSISVRDLEKLLAARAASDDTGEKPLPPSPSKGRGRRPTASPTVLSK
jgi:hypothetical protein